MASHVLNMLQDIPYQCPIIKMPSRVFSVGQVLKGLSSLPLSSCSEMCIAQTKALFISLLGSGGGNESIYSEGLPAVLEGIGKLVCLRGV